MISQGRGPIKYDDDDDNDDNYDGNDDHDDYTVFS